MATCISIQSHKPCHPVYHHWFQWYVSYCQWGNCGRALAMVARFLESWAVLLCRFNHQYPSSLQWWPAGWSLSFNLWLTGFSMLFGREQEYGVGSFLHHWCIDELLWLTVSGVYSVALFGLFSWLHSPPPFTKTLHLQFIQQMRKIDFFHIQECIVSTISAVSLRVQMQAYFLRDTS